MPDTEIPIRFADLHRSPTRHAYFASERAGIVYDETMRCWIVDEPALALQALTSDRIEALDYVGRTQRLRVGGHALDNELFALHHLPIPWNGETHGALRRAIARHLAARRTIIETALPGVVARHIERFERSGPLEVMAEVLVPLVNEATGLIVGIEVGRHVQTGFASAIFDRMLGPRRHAAIDDEIASIRTVIRNTLGADWSEEAEGVRLALWILGHDPLLGTVGESLRRLLDEFSGSRLADIPWSEIPAETGVPYVGRTAMADVDIGPVRIAAGEHIRVLLQGFGYSGQERDAGRIFGAGVHACLGRPIALDLWRLVTENLRRIDRVVTFAGSEPRVSDFVFVCPDTLHIALNS
jgi:cytochrome P450